MAHPSRATPIVTTAYFAVVLTLAGKLGALLKDLLIAAYFGSSPETDAYFVANIIPSLVWAAISLAIPSTLIPLYVKALQFKGQSEQLAREAVSIFVLAGIAMGAATYIFSARLVEWSAPNLNPATAQLATDLLRIMALSMAATGFVAVQNALQQARGQYLAPLSVPAVNNALVCVAIVVAGILNDISIAIIAAVSAWWLQCLLQRWQTRSAYRGIAQIPVRSETLGRIVVLAWPIAIGIFLDQANVYIGVAIAGRFGEGAVSHVSYSARLALFIGNLVSWLVAYFLFPRIAAHAAQGNDTGAGRELGLGIVLIVALTAPLLAIAVCFGTDIIRLVYGRGAFDDAAVRATAAVFIPFALGTVFMGLRELLNRALFSYQRTRVPMVIGAVAAAINLAAGIWLSQRLGPPGIGMAAALSAFVFAGLQIAVIAVWKPVLLDPMAIRRAILLAAAAAIGFGAGLVVSGLVADAHYLARLLIGGAAIGIAYLAAALVFDRVFSLGMAAELRLLRGSSRRGPA